MACLTSTSDLLRSIQPAELYDRRKTPMTAEFEPYEQLGRYPLDEEVRHQLYRDQLECTVAWTNRDGWPVAVVHWFVWHDDRFWVTTLRERKRVSALQERPQSCVVVSSAGTRLGPARTVTAKTLATVHEGAEAAVGWYFPALAAKAWGNDPKEEDRFLRMLRSTDRLIIEFAPVKYITYDAMKMQHAIQTGRHNTID